LQADDLEPPVAGRHLGRGAAEPRALAERRHELLVGAEVVDEAEADVGHRVARGDRDAETVRGDRAARVQRAVDRIDDHPRRPAVAEDDLAALLGDGDERGAFPSQLLQLDEDLVLAAAVDHQRVVTALADALVVGAFLGGHDLLEDPPLRGDDAATDRGPVGGEDVHGAETTEAPRPATGARLRRGTPARYVWTMRQTDPIATGEAGGRMRAAAHVDGPLLVLGAAGTGKSELLARRLADLAAAG